MDTLSSYARQFMGALERPDVDSITGLSPIIAIEQKTTGRNPRSTVGTITEIYDFLRLLYARASIAYSPVTGLEMIKYSDEQIVRAHNCKSTKAKNRFCSRRLSRVERAHYKELFEQLVTKRIRAGEGRRTCLGPRIAKTLWTDTNRTFYRSWW